MLMREAAVYVVVLMLPLAFSALVWPARRVWAIRAVELLIALILSKFAIVAVLSLGGAAMDQVEHSITAPIIGLVLLMMAAFAPWALLRLIPLSELGASALESLRGHGQTVSARTDGPFADALTGEEWATATTAEMRRGAEEAASGPQSGSARLPDEEVVGERDTTAVEPVSDQDPWEAAEPAGVPEPVGAAVPGDASAPAGSTAAPDADERLPGLSDMWQAGDLSWRPLVLGTEEGWPPRVWAPEGSDEPAGPDPAGPSAGPDPADGLAPEGAGGLPDPESPPPDPLPTDPPPTDPPPDES
jgi:hypothetical protein